MLLVGITGASGIWLEGSLIRDPLRFGLSLLLLMAAGGSANAFNQAFERERDALMSRTRMRRPLPLGRISAVEAFVFASLLGLVAVVGYGIWFNLLTSLLALGTILFYALYYTLYLKPRTAQNIVIGGAAGAMAPVIGWVSGSGQIGLMPVLLFLIIFLWTPPHFWALALCLKDDYRRAGLPMMPNVAGDRATWQLIMIYTLLTITTSIALSLAGAGMAYLAVAVLLGLQLIRKVRLAERSGERKVVMGLFGYSIVYLLALFVALIVDRGFGG